MLFVLYRRRTEHDLRRTASIKRTKCNFQVRRWRRQRRQRRRRKYYYMIVIVRIMLFFIIVKQNAFEWSVRARRVYPLYYTLKDAEERISEPSDRQTLSPGSGHGPPQRAWILSPFVIAVPPLYCLRHRR